jgi:hypothetical protein
MRCSQEALPGSQTSATSSFAPTTPAPSTSRPRDESKGGSTPRWQTPRPARRRGGGTEPRETGHRACTQSRQDLRRELLEGEARRSEDVEPSLLPENPNPGGSDRGLPYEGRPSHRSSVHTKIVEVEGVEPSTSCLQSKRSTTELHPRLALQHSVDYRRSCGARKPRPCG